MKKYSKKALISLMAAASLVTAACGEKKVDIKDSSQWHIIETDEYSITLPDNYKIGDQSVASQLGEVQLAIYDYDDAHVAITKIPFSFNEAMRNIDLKKQLQTFNIGGERLNVHELDNGVYYTYGQNIAGMFGDTADLYNVHGMFMGSDGLYAVMTMCRDSEKAEYEETMIQWISSFKVK